MPTRNHGRSHPILLLALSACGDAGTAATTASTGSDAATTAADATSSTPATGDASSDDPAPTGSTAPDATSPTSTTSDPPAPTSTTSDPGTTGEPDQCDHGDGNPPENPPQPGPPGDYTGKQYDFGGMVTQISGQVPEVDAIANSIMAESAATVQEIAAQRATLTYGGIHDPCATKQLITYPGPPGIPASDQYTVQVEQDGAPQDSFVYKILARKKDSNRGLDTSWTSFSFKDPITVRVTKLGEAATGCIVRPFQDGIQTEFAANVCTFTLTGPGQFSVEFEPNIHNPVLHPMLVFANPPEVDVPPADDPSVRYFGPGVHQPGNNQPIQSNQTIYIAGGAWVDGAFLASGPVENVVIKGRGVLSGLFMDTGDQGLNKDIPGMIDIPYGASNNLLIEGLTLVDGPRFNVRALAQHTTLTNLKIMSWWYSTDGVVGGVKSLIQDNFIKVNDDSIKLHWGDTIARRNVLWQLENGGTFNISWNIHDDVDTFHVYDNDVIHAEHYDIEAVSVFRSRHAGSGTLSRYLFDDIRVENANWRLFYLVIENNKWYDPNLGYGEIEQLIFRNIKSYNTSHQRPNVVQGIDGTHKVRNVSLQNVFTDDKCLSDAVNGDFDIDPATTNAVRIMKSKDGSCHTP